MGQARGKEEKGEGARGEGREMRDEGRVFGAQCAADQRIKMVGQAATLRSDPQINLRG